VPDGVLAAPASGPHLDIDITATRPNGVSHRECPFSVGLGDIRRCRPERTRFDRPQAPGTLFAAADGPSRQTGLFW